MATNETKQRVFFGPFEEPDQECAVMDLDIAQQTLKEWFETGEPGDRVVFRIEEMTEAEIDALPEL